MGPEIYLLLWLFCLLGISLLLAFLLIGVWLWMLVDWNKRERSDPATHERYKIQMLVGWPFGYFLNVYRKNGPA
jgi:hypothetical protein